MSATRSLAPGVKSHTHRAGPDPARVDIAARHCTPQLHADPPGRVPRQAAPARNGTNSMPYGRPDADLSRPYCSAALTTREEPNQGEQIWVQGSPVQGRKRAGGVTRRPATSRTWCWSRVLATVRASRK